MGEGAHIPQRLQRNGTLALSAFHCHRRFEGELHLTCTCISPPASDLCTHAAKLSPLTLDSAKLSQGYRGWVRKPMIEENVIVNRWRRV